MNKFQMAYSVAKAQYEDASHKAYAYTAPAYDNLDITDDELEAVEIEAEIKFNLNELRDILRTAEEALLDWSLNKVSKIAMIGEETGAIATVKQNLHKVTVRKQVLEAAMKLS